MKRIKKIDSLLTENRNLKIQINDLQNSVSFRIGRFILLPVRILRYSKHNTMKFIIRNKNIAGVKQAIAKNYGLTISNSFLRPNVSLVVRSIEHPTSSTFIRMISPLRYIVQKKKWRIELVDGDRPRISSSSKIVIVQRTALINTAAAEYLIKKVKKTGAKLYVDTDDAFGDLDPSHPQYELQKQRIEALDKIIDKASMVWFSTPELQKTYSANKSKVIRNTLDNKIWEGLESKDIKTPKSDQPLEIIYMGTKTHDGDYAVILPALQKLHEHYPGTFRLHLVGVCDIKNSEAWVVRHNPVNGLYPYFVQWFNTIGPFDIGLAPLEDTKFNSSKSDIKCLDYLAIGAKPIVSNVRAYRNKELDKHIVRVNNTTEEWFKVLEKEIIKKDTNRNSQETRINLGRKYIIEHRLYDVAGKELLESVIEEDAC